MFKWKKLGKVFDPKDLTVPSWMHEFAQSPSALINEEGVRVFFCSRPAPGPDGKYLSYISFVDLSRKNPLEVVRVCERPVLQLGRLGTFDEFGTYPVSVIRDGNQVRAYYAGWTRCESVPFNAAIGLAISSDGGESFERLGEGPVLSYSLDEPFLLGSPRIRKFGDLWHLWYVSGKEWRRLGNGVEPVYKIRHASSADGISWIKQGVDLISDKLGPHECQACPDVIKYDGVYHMFFSYRDIHNYRKGDGGYRIGYASSSDLITWKREDELVRIERSQSGWDSEMVNYPHVFLLDDEMYMLYQGNEMGRAGFGLAILEKPLMGTKSEVD